MTLESDKKPSILVIGAKSMIGSRFCELGMDRAQIIQSDLNGENNVDITNSNQVEELFAAHKTDWAVLFSAYTDVDGAELQKGDREGSCFRINVNGAKNVVDACQKHGTGLVFISTDFVFDGKNGPYREDDPPAKDLSTVSWYGRTKLEGEKMVGRLPKFLILRISYPFRANFPTKTDFARSILEKYKNSNLHAMFSDQQFSPTFADDLAPAILLLLSKEETGTFHIASPQLTNPYEFAKFLLATFNLDSSQVNEGSLEEFLEKGNTPRPLNGGLVVDRIISVGFEPTNWQQGIKKIHEQIIKEN